MWICCLHLPPVGDRYLHDLAFRGSLSIYQGMIINFLYVLFCIGAGIRYTSVWFISMAAYHMVLGGLRAYLASCDRRREACGFSFAYRCYRRTAWLLFLLLEHMKSVNDGIVTRLRDCPANELYLVTPKYLTPYLAYIKAHKRLFRTAVDHSAIFRMDEVYERLFRHVFSPILERFQVPEQDRNYLMAFYMQGLMAVITQWMKQDCADSTDHIISVIQQCVMRQRENQEGS